MYNICECGPWKGAGGGVIQLISTQLVLSRQFISKQIVWEIIYEEYVYPCGLATTTAYKVFEKVMV